MNNENGPKKDAHDLSFLFSPEAWADDDIIVTMGGYGLEVRNAKQSWDVATIFIDSIPDWLVKGSGKRLTTLFGLYAGVVKKEIERRLPDNGKEADTFIDQTMHIVRSGHVTWALNNLTIGLLEILPEKGRNGAVDSRMEGVFTHLESKDHTMLHMIDGQGGTGILTGALHYVSRFRQYPPEEVFSAYPELFFSNPASIDLK